MTKISNYIYTNLKKTKLNKKLKLQQPANTGHGGINKY